MFISFSHCCKFLLEIYIFPVYLFNNSLEAHEMSFSCLPTTIWLFQFQILLTMHDSPHPLHSKYSFIWLPFLGLTYNKEKNLIQLSALFLALLPYSCLHLSTSLLVSQKYQFAPGTQQGWKNLFLNDMLNDSQQNCFIYLVPSHSQYSVI